MTPFSLKGNSSSESILLYYPGRTEYAPGRGRYSLRTREVLPPNNARLKAFLETMGERVNRRPAEKGVNDEKEKGTAQHLYAYVKWYGRS